MQAGRCHFALLVLNGACTVPVLGQQAPSGASGCIWTSPEGAQFDLTPLTSAIGHYAFRGIVGDHDSLHAATGFYHDFDLGQYYYYVNLCEPATNFHFDKCDEKQPANVYQVHKDPSNDDCFALNSPGAAGAEFRLIDKKNPEVGLQLYLTGGEECHKEVVHTKTAKDCTDAPGWTDRNGHDCAHYVRKRWCGGAFVPAVARPGQTDAWTGCCASCRSWWEAEVICPPLAIPANGEPLTYTNHRKWPSIATYSCQSGYTLSGGYSKRECGVNSHWKGDEPTCVEEPYYGRGRMGRHRYHDYNNNNDGADDQGSTEVVVPLEAETETEWVTEPRSILINMTCDRTIGDDYASIINMAHRVIATEADMCEYLIKWPSKYACPLLPGEVRPEVAFGSAAATNRSSSSWASWLPYHFALLITCAPTAPALARLAVSPLSQLHVDASGEKPHIYFTCTA